MAIRTLSEMRSHLATRVRDISINSFITDCLNLALSEIHYYSDWSWLKRKTTFATVASQEDYRLDEEVDRIMLIRQRSTPVKLRYVPDRVFYDHVPHPEDIGTGPPRFYRQWEETGFTASLAANDTIQVLSSSTSDGSSFTVRVVGRNADGVVIHETLTLNGTTAVTSSTTFASGSLMRVSKSADTTGVITVRRTTGSTVLIRVAPTEANPRSKIISLFPIPSSAVTMYLEYLERLQLLVADPDVPQLDPQWHWVVMEGALVHLWLYKENEAATAAATSAFTRGLALMLRADGATRFDYVPVLEPRRSFGPEIVKRFADSVDNAFPVYGVGW